MDTQFVGEHLLPGKLGQFFIILSFGTSLLSLISYFFATTKNDASWGKIGRISFLINGVAIVGIGACLFYIIYNHYFEYHYAWAHSSTTLPVYYIISSFWEGQEGSFWLWAFWQVVLGFVLIFKAKSWENSVMTIIALSQAFLCSMLIGVEIFGVKIGSSPFILLRNAMEAPIFARADYLSLIADGNGLNPLLQNYWMVIHPPTLFLGFAAMIVPFAYAIAGLWTKRYKELVSYALPWSLFAVVVLGTGIIMGSFWAYEALNFGGFWAWDPVENASVIPWLTLIAAVHVLIAYKNTGHSYFTALFLIIISFVLVLYASFLTRSGILGETSVHAFTSMGMDNQLLIFMGVFTIIPLYLIIKNWKNFPITKKDEETYSREFWLFIGAITLSVSCIQIIATTSIPVFNKIFGTDIAPPTDVIQHYNKWQLAFFVVVAVVSAFSQFLKYKRTEVKRFYISISVSAFVSVLLTGVFVYITDVYHNLGYILLVWAAVFSIICNGKILGEAVKGKWKLAGSSIAHIGFGMLLIGALVAAATSSVVSVNNTGIGYGDEFAKNNNPRENIILYKNDPIKMDKYTVTYLGDSTSGVNTYYRVNYKVLDEKGNIKENFNLYPHAQQNAKMRQIVASPDTKHYLLHDIYTHVSSVPLKEEEHTHDEHSDHSEDDHYEEPVPHEVSVGDTIRLRESKVVVKDINRNATIQNIPLSKEDVAIGMKLEVITDHASYYAEPIFLIKGNTKLDFGKKVDEAGLKLRFTNILPQKDKLELTIYQKPKEDKKDWIVMKAVMFPYINLFWGGTIIMVIGFIISIFRRSKELK
ncbi:cytochrome c assembly protein [Pseudopedobacter saltans DSM 12145]|uniref:Cytochrome c assembly protein n=1 Tax=Pseudopedobacter saltans (strain ATCC 51119 / DSM 12145 / JCM 21818 / CCUG 39354 / LMG 10337 / NBRC 100064 / NCIMB 13643) TaxID=762903 RepID=F0S9R6_PSESL|nr:cytochrome c biogenesis protein CcsA [Pseudopedobacter saltans]ADY51422.1 cytochrome c assembly protein [Pseudopedobacter saltans DSM 12145]